MPGPTLNPSPANPKELEDRWRRLLGIAFGLAVFVIFVVFGLGVTDSMGRAKLVTAALGVSILGQLAINLAIRVVLRRRLAAKDRA